MWSKTRKAMYDRLAPSLKGRVVFEVQYYEKLKCQCEMCANSHKQLIIIVDKVPYTIAGAGAYNQYSIKYKVLEELNITDTLLYYRDSTVERKVRNKMFYKTGLMFFYDAMKRIHEYLNCVSVEECLSGEDYFLYLLAILDRRVGKRRIRRIYENIDSEPEWIRKFIILRAEAEHIIKGNIEKEQGGAGS